MEVVRLYESVRSSEGRCEGEGGGRVEVDVGCVGSCDNVAFEVETSKEKEDKDGSEDWVRWRRQWRRRRGRGRKRFESGRGRQG